MTLRQARFAAVFITICILMPSLTMAAGLVTVVPDNCRGNGGCQSVCDLAQLAQNVLNDGIYLAVFLSAILFAWAGFTMMMSLENAGKRTKAKETFFNVAVGLIIVLAAWLVVDVVMRTLVGGNIYPWNKVC